jgi:hypothetical protein
VPDERVEVASTKLTLFPSLDLSPAISSGAVHVQDPFPSSMVCPARSPASAFPTVSGLPHCAAPEIFVCAPAAAANRNVNLQYPECELSSDLPRVLKML